MDLLIGLPSNQLYTKTSSTHAGWTCNITIAINMPQIEKLLIRRGRQVFPSAMIRWRSKDQLPALLVRNPFETT